MRRGYLVNPYEESHDTVGYEGPEGKVWVETVTFKYPESLEKHKQEVEDFLKQKYPEEFV